MTDFAFKDKYGFNDLLRIMEILRAPDGCTVSYTHLTLPTT